MNKEQNFVSAVVYIESDDDHTLQFFQMLHQCLESHFLQYEIVVVNANSTGHSMQNLRNWANCMEKPLTIINMSLRQPHEQCMNAGLDIAIGDYVYEFDSTDMPYSSDIIWTAYQTAIQGNDIVTVCPKKERSVSSLFYRIFNSHSNSTYKLRTDAFRLVSRRAINRAHAMNENLPYRKAAYAACGLKMAVLEFQGRMSSKGSGQFELAVDSLALYTNFGYRFSLGLTCLMIVVSAMELIYTLAVWLAGNPISGWTTTMFVLTLGLTGLFMILAIALKYLSLLLKLTFQKQSYLVESIEKL